MYVYYLDCLLSSNDLITAIMSFFAIISTLLSGGMTGGFVSDPELCCFKQIVKYDKIVRVDVNQNSFIDHTSWCGKKTDIKWPNRNLIN